MTTGRGPRQGASFDEWVRAEGSRIYVGVGMSAPELFKPAPRIWARCHVGRREWYGPDKRFGKMLSIDDLSVLVDYPLAKPGEDVHDVWRRHGVCQ